MLPVVQGNFKGEGALAVPVVVFGNRNFDNGLIELRNELENNGFHTVAGAGIATSHVFSDVIAPGRPDEKDMALIEEFAKKAARKVSEMTEIPAPIAVRGDDPVGPYYTPLGTDGKPAVFLKAKPLTNMELCDGCGICAQVCPMGSINPENCAEVTGICIKCQACIKKRPSLPRRQPPPRHRAARSFGARCLPPVRCPERAGAPCRGGCKVFLLYHGLF